MKYKSPVYNVMAVPIEKVRPNNYNPNKVAPPEMKLLYESIKEDGYTMPVVCYYVKAQDIYLIVDGFHRYQVMMDHPDIYEREQGLLPVSVIEKPIDKRMASTVRHNRARGSHDVDLMSNIVKELHEFGRSDASSSTMALPRKAWAVAREISSSLRRIWAERSRLKVRIVPSITTS